MIFMRITCGTSRAAHIPDCRPAQIVKLCFVVVQYEQRANFCDLHHTKDLGIAVSTSPVLYPCIIF
jgi:hypothetical protein